MQCLQWKNPTCLAIACLLWGCATQEEIEPDNARFDFAFLAPGGKTFVTRFEGDSLVWTLDKAQGCVGEIGIHWSRTLGKAAAHAKASAASHDVPGGKISPKIYAYQAIDFLAGSDPQALTVGPAVYDHIHMVFRPAADTTVGISDSPELLGHSLWISGSVTHGDTTAPFTFAIDKTYKENDLGDVLFTLEVRQKDSYELGLTPKLGNWFNEVLWGDLIPTRGDTVDMRLDNENKAAAAKIERRFEFDNAFELMAEKNAGI